MQTDYAKFMQNDYAMACKIMRNDYAKLKNTKAEKMQGKGDIHYFLLGAEERS